jgi:hypothetical protein
MSSATLTRNGAALAAFEKLDAQLRAWALAQGSDEHQFSVLIDARTLRRAEYPEAFPHLLMSTATATDPLRPLDDANLTMADWFLSPAVCYHAYASLEGREVAPGVMLTARGHCFRHEEAADLAPGRRQVEFQMRELVLVGEAPWIEERLAVLQQGVDALASACGLVGTWCPANDPFFLPRARGKAQMQRLLGTKIELCLADGLAIASINRHGTFFGERFHIRTAIDQPARSACVAFGLDRWAHAATSAL